MTRRIPRVFFCCWPCTNSFQFFRCRHSPLVSMHEDDDDALWREAGHHWLWIPSKPWSPTCLVRTLITVVQSRSQRRPTRILAVITVRHGSEGQGSGISTSRDGAAGSRDGDPSTMDQQFADHVCHRGPNIHRASTGPGRIATDAIACRRCLCVSY